MLFGFFLISVMPKKEILHLQVDANERLRADLHLLRMRRTDGQPMRPMPAGNFVQVRPPQNATTLNRPISVCDCYADYLELLVRRAGAGTDAMCDAQSGTMITVIGPMGNTFSTTATAPLLVGGGVGIAPIFALAKAYAGKGICPEVVFGKRTAPAQQIVTKLEKVARVHICTDDGSEGFHGLVTDSPAWNGSFDMVHTCGPLPMMKAVAAKAAAAGISCEVSLENRMACGIGACLCCVEDTTDGRRCVCTHGPVFNTKELTW